jgi:hypothetical protein
VRLRRLARRATALALAVAGGLAGLAALAPAAAAGTLSSPVWSASKTTISAAGVSYSYSVTAATAATLTSVTMTVPTGTGGSPTVGTVSPATLAGGTVSLSGTTLTYSFAGTPVIAGTAIAIQVKGLTNTSAVGTYTSVVTTRNASGAVDTGTTPGVTFTTTALTSLGWSASSTAVGATGVSYTYTFTTTQTALITSFTMTVPPGTGGTPTLGATTPAIIGSASLSGTTLTVSGLSFTLAGGTAVSIQVKGLTNTSIAGSYPAQIVTGSLASSVDSGTTPALTFSGPLTLTSPSALGWAATVTGIDQSAVDPSTVHQQFSVTDATVTGAGWHITVAATTFTTGATSLPNAGTFSLTGSLASATATTAPSAACASACVPPVTTGSYPVAITTAATAPVPTTVYDVTAGSGLGAITVGGFGAASPVGWWLGIPANALAGSYSSTVTVAVVSGP